MKEQLSELLRSRYGLENLSLEFLREGGSRTYIVTGAEKYLLKVISPAFAATAERSVSVMRYLEQNGFPVPRTVLASGGEAFVKASLEGEERMIVLQEYIEGEEPDLEKTAPAVGELIARLHSLMENCPVQPVSHDKHFFIGRYLDFLRKKAYPRISEYEALGERLWQRVKDLPAGICHGDLHRGNLIETPSGEIYLTDFDTVCRAPLMFDISVMCDMTNYFELKQEDIETTKKVYADFVSAYIRRRSLSREEVLSFPCWVALRHFQLQATILEIHGIDCIDERFIDWQLYWLNKWPENV